MLFNINARLSLGKGEVECSIHSSGTIFQRLSEDDAAPVCRNVHEQGANMAVVLHKSCTACPTL